MDVKINYLRNEYVMILQSNKSQLVNRLVKN